MTVHPSAIVHPGARLAHDVEVGPFAIIGEYVEIGAGTRIGAHAVITGNTRIGRNNRIFHHATLGVIGMGRIGQAVAKRALGFDMRVLYNNRSRIPEADEKRLDATWVERDRLLRESDFVVVMAPYSAATHHLVGAAEIAKMKPTAILVNSARGGVVDDAALVEALREGRIAGAGLDVFEGEPKVHPGFLDLKNVVMTPHIGSASRATRIVMCNTAAANMTAVLEGRAPPNPVN